MKKKSIADVVRAQRSSKHPILRFVLVFGLLMGLYYALVVTTLFNEYVLNPHLRFNAKVSSFILRLFGEEARASNMSVSSVSFSISIARGCDALGPSALLVAGILAFPAAFSRKISGILVGILILFAVNFIRIVSLFLIGSYYPQAFQVMHFDLWQVIFVLLVITIWFFWLRWATQGRALKRNASSQVN